MAAIPDGSGWREAYIPIESPEAMARQLLPFGRHVEVIGPDNLRSTMCLHAAELMELYSASPNDGHANSEQAISVESAPMDEHWITA